MRFVTIERTETGYFLDPRPYLAWLAEFGDQLPAGASAFAADPAHYDFASTKCVKDLRLATIIVHDAASQISVEMQFSPNEFKHDLGLRIRYEDVFEISVDVVGETGKDYAWPGGQRLGDFQLDEILPHERGCRHEIAMTGGNVKIVASDLHAEWVTE